MYPHKTDACPMCACLSADRRSAKQTLKRHEQQSDKGCLTRQKALEETVQVIKDLEAAAKSHTDEAGRAMEIHRKCVSGAAGKYARLTTKFLQLMEMTGVGQQPTTDATAKQDSFIGEASSDWFDVSCDYQQDKQMPAWNRSPQPGPTYFMSGETHYVHIFCVESCGVSSGSDRLSRNIVYTRSERDGGSKSSDDTLSTLCDMLRGGVTVGVGDPPVFRSGFTTED